jgi:DNA-binding SARP family transcriptional activator/WD40 repeat protein/energy-coupling factor transporter ATP-binding protein EcfA2
MGYRVLGPLAVDGRPHEALGGYRQRLVIAVLLSHPNRALPTDAIVDAVWGEHPPRTARRTLHVYLARLRRVLDPDAIEAVPGGYRVNATAEQLDSLRFEQLARRGHDLLGTDPAGAARVLRDGLDLWRGVAFGDLHDEPALQLEAGRLDELRLAALTDRLQADLDRGHAARVVAEVRTLASEHPLSERVQGLLILALYRSGRHAEALAAYDQVRRALDDELGLAPSPELQRLQQAVLRHDPALLGAAEPVVDDDWADAANPYKGLRAFGPDDAADFFGRDELVDVLADRVQHTRLVAVVGPSGCGKSSVVLAGLLPRLQHDQTSPRRRTAVMVPGRHPFERFLAALGHDDLTVSLQGDDLDLVRTVEQVLPEDGTRLLLVIDQFEELLAPTVDASTRSRFLRNLVEAVEDPPGRLDVVVTFRSDFLDQCLREMPLGRLISAGMVTVLPLSPAELQDAAARPAERVGARIEPPLLAELVADMTDEPGALPLFQYALTEVFEQRGSGVLTRADYRAIGGLRGALARRAEHVYQSLGAAQRAAARQVLLRLVSVADGAPDTRRRLAREVLEGLPAAPDVLRVTLHAFDEARLLTFDRDPAGHATVEVAHEALLREWPRLARWIDDARVDLRLHRSLATEAAEWEASGRDDDYLLAGSRLAHLEGWEADSTIDLTPAERLFLHASTENRNRLVALEQQRQVRELENERRAGRRLRWLVAVVTVAALVTTGLSMVATNRSRAATAQQVESRVRELASMADVQVSVDPELAVLLALEATELAGRSGQPSLQTAAASALHHAVRHDRVVARLDGEHVALFTWDGSLVLGGRQPRLVHPGTGAATDLPPLEREAVVVSVAQSPDGRLLALGGRTPPPGSEAGHRSERPSLSDVLVVDTGTGETHRSLVDPRFGASHSQDVADLTFVGPDRLVTLGSGQGDRGDDGAKVWDLPSGEVVTRMVPRGTRLAFATGEAMLAEAGEGSITVVALDGGRVAQRLSGVEAPPTAIAFGSDLVVSGHEDGVLALWERRTGTMLASAQLPASVTALAFEPVSGVLLTGTVGGDVLQWQVEPGGLRVQRSLGRLAGGVADLDVRQDGRLGAGVAQAGGVLVWSLVRRDPVELAAWPARETVASASRRGDVATLTADGTAVRLVRPSDWRTRSLLPLPRELAAGASTIALSPDAAAVAVGGGQQGAPAWASLWDVPTGEPLPSLTFRVSHGEFDPHLSGIVEFSPDGSSLAAGLCHDDGASAAMFDVPPSRVEALLFGPSDCTVAVAFAAGGRRVAVQSTNARYPNVRVWDLDPLTHVAEIRHVAGDPSGLAFSPDGARLVTAGADGVARVWELPAVHAPADSGLAPRQALALTGHAAPLTAVLWSSDGSTIVTAGQDQSVRFWDAASGTPGLVLSDLGGPVQMTAAPDLSYLVTSAGGEARAWTLVTEELTELARSRLSRRFSAEECATFRIDPCPSAG